MSQSNYTERDVSHRMRLLEGFLDREVERLKQSIPQMERRLADLRFVISHMDGRARTHSLNGPICIYRGTNSSFPAQVARKLRIGECADSSLWFEIDESGHWFTLQARLAGLLKFLVSDSAGDRDGNGMMPLYSREEVLAYLTATGKGHEYKASFVHKMVNKLGEKMRHHDSRNLVDSSKQGIRFLVRRCGVELVKLDKPPHEVVRRRPQPRFLQMAARPTESIGDFVTDGDRTAERRTLRSEDHT